ncbi:hypothetical protein PE067_10315 [Paracoccus sp. DMF-8]|uniref:hypothetical protein n=1 Tax=Paracoccus sp. DMF-8 TaxID=3019445 RepID=UPI0023E76E1C|nr:hypothetical protein [Paracoccus sp. DMF-8]MDF3606502.1 hypothetical protein [Paracoccus sp. DMF-8]
MFMRAVLARRLAKEKTGARKDGERVKDWAGLSEQSGPDRETTPGDPWPLDRRAVHP